MGQLPETGISFSANAVYQDIQLNTSGLWPTMHVSLGSTRHKLSKSQVSKKSYYKSIDGIF